MSFLDVSDFEIKRSPARVCWHVLFNGQLICTANTKAEAAAEVERLSKVYRSQV